MLLGDRIKQIRLSKHMKQSDLAEKANISRVAVGNYERGDREPTAKILQQIALALDVKPNDLLGWNEAEQKVNEENSFISYLKSLGYFHSYDPVEILESHIEDVTDDSGTVIGQTQVIDKEIVNHLLSKDGITSVFTEEEFTALQDKNKESLEGAILLQSQKNKKEPSSAATDNGSDNENTIE